MDSVIIPFNNVIMKTLNKKILSLNLVNSYNAYYSDLKMTLKIYLNDKGLKSPWKCNSLAFPFKYKRDPASFISYSLVPSLELALWEGLPHWWSLYKNLFLLLFLYFLLPSFISYLVTKKFILESFHPRGVECVQLKYFRLLPSLTLERVIDIKCCYFWLNQPSFSTLRVKVVSSPSQPQHSIDKGSHLFGLPNLWSFLSPALLSFFFLYPSSFSISLHLLSQCSASLSKFLIHL